MTINAFRGFLYRLARLLGDVNAIEKGRVPRRILRRVAGKLTGRFLGRLFRVLLLAMVLTGSAFAAERTDIFDQYGERKGYVRENPNGSFDMFDKNSNRTGWGRRNRDGSVELFNTDGSRRATITPGGDGRPARIVVPRGKR